MKKAILLFTTALLLLASSTVNAEGKEVRPVVRLLPIRYGIAHVGYAYNHEAELKEAPGEKVSYHIIDVMGFFPIPVTEDFFFSVGLQYYFHHFRLHDVTNYYPANTVNVHSIGLMLDGIYVFNDNWLLDVNFTPTIQSDLKEINSHDFQYVGRVFANWAFNDWCAMLFGVGVSKEFWTYMPYPLLGFSIRPKNSFFSFETVLPAYMRFNFDVASFAQLFIQGEFYGFVWDLENKGQVPDHFMKMYDSRAGAGAAFELFKGFHLEVWGGVNPYRKFSYRDRNNTPFSTTQKMNFFAAASIFITPKLFGLE